MDLCQHIKEIILEQLQGALVIVSDPQNDATHLEAIVVSDEFKGIPLITQHRRVMNIMKDSFQNELHALKLKTYSFDQWELINGGDL